MPIDFDELERLTRLVESYDIQELTVREGDSRITIRKRRSSVAGSSGALGVAPRSDTVREHETEGDDEFERVIGSAEEAEEIVWINASLVGFFHHERPPIGVGSRVEQGQVVGSIEAMKLMTALECETSGVIVEVLVEDGQAVEYGQPLFAIRTEIGAE